jgi:hypothetical protein
LSTLTIYGRTNDALCLCLLPDLQKQKLVHLNVPAWAVIDHDQYKSLESLSIQRAYLLTDSVNHRSRVVDRFPYLRKFSLEIDKEHEFISPLFDLSLFPILEELYVITTRLWTEPGFCTGMSNSLQQLVMVGGFGMNTLRQFTDWLLEMSNDTIRSISLKDLIFLPPRYDEPPRDLMPSLRSVKLVGIPPIHLLYMPWTGIRKVLIDHIDPIPMEVVSKILQTATRLVSCSIISQNPGIKATWNTTNLTYSPECVKALSASQYLTHFQSIGPYVFTDADWKTLCTTRFKKLKLLHVVQLYACEDMTNNGIKVRHYTSLTY